MGKAQFSCWPSSIWDCQPLAGLHDPTLVDLLIWSAFWTALYACLTIAMPKEKPDWVIRIHSTLHATIALTLSFRCIFVEDERHPLDPSRLHEPNTALQNLTLVMSSGYFLFDFIWCMVYEREATMLAHHVSSAIALVASLLLGESGYETTAVLAGSELTNPFLATRWYLKSLGYYKTRFGFINDTFFAVTFTFLRIGWGSGMFYNYFIRGVEGHPLIKVGGGLLYLISVYWCFMIWKVYRYKWFNSSVKTIKIN
eukprot:m.8960 g.8960  ORF g.8960 m.8960 type:complete len:255 (-) comp9327_c0_seq1:6-770(-)